MDLDIEFWVFVEAVEVHRSSEVLHSQHGNVLLVLLQLAHQGIWELKITLYYHLDVLFIYYTSSCDITQV